LAIAVSDSDGIRAVIRHTTFDLAGCYYDAIDAHDPLEHGAGTNRGTMGYEFYENKIYSNGAGGARIVHLRGGQHTFYNNYFEESVAYRLVVTSYMYQDRPDLCNGNVWDDDDSDPDSCNDQINHSYFYNNKDGCGSGDMENCSGGDTISVTNDSSAVIFLNTHYYHSMPPGYTEYEYPHPLQD
jgi:hypothetical protein